MRAESVLASAPSPQYAPLPPPASAPAPASTAPPRHTADDGEPSTFLDPGAAHPVPVREAIAVLLPTKGSNVRGLVRFRDNGDSLDVTASVTGLPGGVHAYHVHVFGDCGSPDAESAGPHFHFRGSSFDEDVRVITGNLGELHARARATTMDRTQIRASLHGRYSIIGRAVVVHEKGNDPASPPDGAAGKRLACGAIGATGPLTAPHTTASHP